ncbi:MAG: TetR/AcrR family transcriptional regulator [Treponema sp.]|nr:TetR/AcrR family transcriptional regulator [Treponema sp.]
MARDTTKSTKELILDAAFSFYEEPVFKDFSMRELAAKVGVSKPAIYRHFDGKEAVIAAMENRVFDTMADYLAKMGGDVQASKLPLASLIDFFIENPCYINYFWYQFSSEKNYEKHIFESLFARNVVLAHGYETLANYEKIVSEHPTFLVKQSYVGTSIFFFVKAVEILRKQGKVTSEPKNHAKNLVEFLASGLRASTEEGDFLHPAAISDSRKQELKKLCSIGEGVLPPENRIFVALANVIRKFKPAGVTVERIADELNMAKSSLYEYFENKNQMVKQLVNNEIALLQTIVNENSVEAANFTEYMFILIWTEFEYFSKRPSLIPICGWLLMLNDSSFNEQKQRSEQCDTIENPWEKRIPDRVVRPDLGFAYSARVLVHWLGVLPIALFIQMTDKGWNEEKQRQGIEILTDFIMNGVK